VLLDCHSMPSIGGPVDRDPGATRADIVLGDRFATSCDPSIVTLVERVLSEAGYVVRRNEPYAGGFTTQHYGRPHLGVHALQIEVKRSLYMDETRFEHGAGFDGVAATMSRVIEALADAAPMALAAE
jgi:N-formylglutamate amidohydrolase